MKKTLSDGKYIIETESYKLEVCDKEITFKLENEEIVNLRPESAVNKFEEPDTPELVLFTPGDDTFVWSAKTSCWDKAEYILKAYEDRVDYCVKLYGNGKVDGVDYFIGNKTAPCPGSGYEFDTGFMPIPTVNGARQCTFSAQECYDEFSYLTIPPIFCYTFDISGVTKKLAIGLFAEKGEHNFTKFTYNTKSENLLCRFWLSTDQSCHTEVKGEWTTPVISLFASDSVEDSVEKFCDRYFTSGVAERKTDYEKPKFWYGPMACGWIEQCAYAMKNNIEIGCQDMAKTELYDNFISEMKRRDLHPNIIIIDDKWQTQYGTAIVNTDKWTDLRGWIDNNLKENNCHTMLWYKLWDAEGLSDDMTMFDEKNNTRVADPTNPKYRALLDENMHRLLSSDEGCYNAYGLKLDFAFLQPVGRECNSYSGQYGAELYLEYIKFIYESAKKYKKEAIISGSPCHPIFNKYLDHARLHDYHPDLRRCYEEFTFRAMLYKNAIPDALIDTDGAAFRTRRDTMRYMRLAPEIGIPDLYCITPLPCMELSDEDWAEVAEVWKKYEKKINS